MILDFFGRADDVDDDDGDWRRWEPLTRLRRWSHKFTKFPANFETTFSKDFEATF